MSTEQGTENTQQEEGQSQETNSSTGGKQQENKDTTDWKAEAEKWKALSRKNEASAKKLQAIEDSQKSELQKAQERIALLEEESKKSSKNALRAQVALDKKLPKVLMERLKGDTLEELQADADSLLKELGIDPTKNGGQGNGSGRSQENLTTLIVGGENGKGGRQMTDMNAFMRNQLPGSH